MGTSDGVGDTSESITLVLEVSQFSRDAALRTAYWFSRDLFIEFPPSEAELTYSVMLKAKTSLPMFDDPKRKSFQELVSEFQNSLVDFELRVRLQKETSEVRELLLAKAFAEAGVLEDNPPGSYYDPVLTAEKSTKPHLTTISPKG